MKRLNLSAWRPVQDAKWMRRSLPPSYIEREDRWPDERIGRQPQSKHRRIIAYARSPVYTKFRQRFRAAQILPDTVGRVCRMALEDSVNLALHCVLSHA
jgi:hypothetical protein